MFIFKILALSLFMQPSPETWLRIDTDQHISFLVPKKVERLQKNTDGMISHIYQTKNQVCVFGVVCTDFSAGKIPLTRENVAQLYEELRRGSISMESAILKDEKTIEFQGMLIKEIEYSIIKGKFEMTYFKRFIFRENMVYQISIGGRTRHLPYILEEKAAFFNSVHFKS